MQKKQNVILNFYRNGESIRKISRDLGISRITVKKYIREYDAKLKELHQTGPQNNHELIDGIVEKPKYNTENRGKRKLTTEIISEVKQYLESNKQKRQSGQRKQQLKKIDIHELLKEKGCQIGYTSICNLVRDLEKEVAEAFIRQTYAAGDICEFDWGEVKIDISKGIEKYQLAVFTSAFSNNRYARLFKHQDTSSFQQSHAYFFQKVEGVYKTLVYDNMKVVVKKFIGPNEKEATDGLLKLSLYYNFSFRFCNVRKGNEKGHVERSVEYVRRKAFAKRDSFTSLAAANEYLEQVCDTLNKKPQKANENKTALDLLKAEQAYLYPVKPFFECGEEFTLKADKYSTVSYKTCRYSVPENNVGKLVNVKVYPEKIICSDDNSNICHHTRLHGLHEWSIKIAHYTQTLKRKPGALKGSLAMSQIDSRLHKIYETYYVNREKDFIDIIEYVKQPLVTIEKIESSIKQLQPCRAEDVTIDKIKILCEREDKSQNPQNNQADEINKMCHSQLILLSQIFPYDDHVNHETVEVL
ncbi:MAG: IS21 family transposase [Methanosarcinaceae archaeon]